MHLNSSSLDLFARQLWQINDINYVKFTFAICKRFRATIVISERGAIAALCQICQGRQISIGPKTTIRSIYTRATRGELQFHFLTAHSCIAQSCLAIKVSHITKHPVLWMLWVYELSSATRRYSRRDFLALICLSVCQGRGQKKRNTLHEAIIIHPR